MTDTAEPESETLRYRIRRDAGGILASMSDIWRSRRWLRVLVYLALAGFTALAVFWFVITRDLPDENKLLAYQPPLPTMVRNGNPVPPPEQ